MIIIEPISNQIYKQNAIIVNLLTFQISTSSDQINQLRTCSPSCLSSSEPAWPYHNMHPLDYHPKMSSIDEHQAHQPFLYL